MERFNCRLSTEEFAALQEYAKVTSRSMTDVIREYIRVLPKAIQEHQSQGLRLKPLAGSEMYQPAVSQIAKTDVANVISCLHDAGYLDVAEERIADITNDLVDRYDLTKED